MSAGRRSGMKAMALRVEALEALVVRYWCGDAPVGAGAIADIRSQVEALPGRELHALLDALGEMSVDELLETGGPSNP